MPLPFLTADRAFDEVADDVALPFDDRDQWRRPYRPGPWRVGFAALLLLLASYVMFAAVIIAFTGGLGGGAVCGIIALLIIGAALRLLRVGTWVSAHGLRRVAFFQTQTVPWAQVVTVRTVQQPVRWLGLPGRCRGRRCSSYGGTRPMRGPPWSPATVRTSSRGPRPSTGLRTPSRCGPRSTGRTRPEPGIREGPRRITGAALHAYSGRTRPQAVTVLPSWSAMARCIALRARGVSRASR